MIADHLLPIPIAFACGLALGALYLNLLQASVRSFSHDAGAVPGVLITIARLGLVGTGLWVSVQFGAVTLLGTLTGFTVMRVLGVRKKRKSSWN